MGKQQNTTSSAMPSTTLESRTPFEPPKKVVPPAFNELLHRLHRVHTSGKPPSQKFLDDERVLFNYGVVQRRRVLQHAAVLIFGQCLVYRQAVVRLTSSRSIRFCTVLPQQLLLSCF